jgi:heme/copper-type cytochrome/quinol oxidase subunit 2
MLQNIIIIVWVLCAIYCLYKLYKRSKMSSYDGVIGYSPGLEVIMVVILGPLLAIIDISLTWIRVYKEAEEARRRAENKGV